MNLTSRILYSTVDLSYADDAEIHTGLNMQREEEAALSGSKEASDYKIMSVVAKLIGNKDLSKLIIVEEKCNLKLKALNKNDIVIADNLLNTQGFKMKPEAGLKIMQMVEDTRLIVKCSDISNKTALSGYNKDERYEATLHEIESKKKEALRQYRDIVPK